MYTVFINLFNKSFLSLQKIVNEKICQKKLLQLLN